MFGEDPGGESPRLPSPWRALSESVTVPSPLCLSTRSTPPLTPTRDEESTCFTQSIDAQSKRNYVKKTLPLKSLITNTDEALASQFEHLGLEKESLSPEIDASGHIEYKLKVAASTPFRLAKLVTQLKFRLVQGGGVALYELGVLDDGTLVGLSYDEMKDSIATLGKMLAALGGGTVKVARVVRLRDDGDDGNDDEQNGSSSASAAAFSHDSMSSVLTNDSEASSSNDHSGLFDDLEVDAAISTADTTDGEESPTVYRVNLKGEAPVDFVVSPADTAKKRAKLYVGRSPEEKARLRWAKKEEKIKRKQIRQELQQAQQQSSPSSAMDSHDGREYDDRIGNSSKRDDRPSSPRLVPTKSNGNLSKHRSPRSDNDVFRPSFRARGEERFVVEAVVTKKFSRRTSIEGVGDDIDDVLPVDEEAGWTHLEFDFLGAQ